MVDRPNVDGTDLKIRRYRPDDAGVVRELHERALRASPMEFVEDAGDETDLLDVSGHYVESGGEFLVGLAGGTVVATGGYQPRAGGTVEMRRLRVHPDYQGRGFGGCLLATLEERARTDDYGRIVLNTHEDLTAARNLYVSRGFEETAREPHPVTGETMISFEKRLR